MLKFEVNGGIREKEGKFILTVYSSPFARYLVSNGIGRVNLNFEGETVVISKGAGKKITIERKKEEHPIIVTYVSKLLSKKIKESILKNDTQLPVRVIINDFISEGELTKYNHRINRAEPKIWDIETEKSLLLKVACYISCFRQNSRKWYRFSVRHRIFEQIVKNQNKVDLCRIGNDFFLKKNSDGNKLSLHKSKDGHSLAYMQISPIFLTKEEEANFENGRTAISSKVFFCKKDFGLDLSDFFYDKKEKDLAKALVNREVNIQIPEMGKREADILLPEINSQIEVTTVMPSKTEKNKNNAHGGGVHINARLCEGYVRAMNNQINKFFVILHEDWMDYQWVKNTYEMIKLKVVLIPTNFKENWAERVADQISIQIKNDRIN